MNWILPGTTLPADTDNAGRVEGLFASMFLPGGMVLSQVASITGLESYAIQNWVKRGFLPPPQGKRYSCSQLCRIITINMLRSALTIEQVCSLLAYVNGDLQDASDDLIDDAALYFLFVKLAAKTGCVTRDQDITPEADEVLSDYAETVPGAKDRIRAVLGVMIFAWSAGQLHSRTEQLLQQLS